MGRNARKRISYVLPLAKSAARGHRLGVNGLAVDPQNSILYSGGRDGAICAWDLNLDLSTTISSKDTADRPPQPPPASVFRQQVQAHTHWINDIVLAQNNEALISASSDITVKLWRPGAQDPSPPQTIGLHSDYVKCLASPGPHATWVASGGLDHKIYLWDLSKSGQQLEIAVGDAENTAKGSVYALAVTDSMIACGGPESIVRIWDPRSGKRITNFVGHTDNVRDVLMSRDGEVIMTASSDQTVKVWSMTAGRCMYTLTMHADSVWSLYSDDPRLSVFYSSDRSGLIAKTDVRGRAEMDEGVSVAVCQEHEGVNKVAQAGKYVWTATSRSSINRWLDVDTEAEVALPESYKFHRTSLSAGGWRFPSPPNNPGGSPLASPARTDGGGTLGSSLGGAPKIPVASLLRLSNTAPFPVLQTREAELAAAPPPVYLTPGMRKPSEVFVEPEHLDVVPIRTLPDYSIEGLNGLIKHHMLNDKRRVLTVDTAGEVMLWDLLQCVPIKSYGKRHLEDVIPHVTTQETVAHWCAVDTRTGSLTVVLEENHCFDAEMYADELKLEEKIDFREDHRINLGKWVLRYLFANLIDEEIRRDEVYRRTLLSERQGGMQRPNVPPSIEIPRPSINGWNAGSTPASATTLRANGLPAQTPGLAIGLATPAVPSSSHGSVGHGNALAATLEEGSTAEATPTTAGPRKSSERDYFSSTPAQQAPATPGGAAGNGKAAEGQEGKGDAAPQSPADGGEKEPNAKEGKGLFGKKFNMSFNMKKLTRQPTAEAKAPAAAAAAEDKAEESDSHSTKTDERPVEDNFAGALQKMRHGYDDALAQADAQQAPGAGGALVSAIAPSLPVDTPLLRPPVATTILIQEDRPDSGGVADLFEGTVGSVGSQADVVEKLAPMWLADVLLRNTIPLKEISKVSFILEPYQNLLPPIATDGSNRLNANRMLRARKILLYIVERIEEQPAPPPTPLAPSSPTSASTTSPSTPHPTAVAAAATSSTTSSTTPTPTPTTTTAATSDPPALRPEDYLELYCNNTPVPPTMTLATVRTHVWRGGGDVLLYYKANGRKEIKIAPAARKLMVAAAGAGEAGTGGAGEAGTADGGAAPAAGGGGGDGAGGAGGGGG